MTGERRGDWFATYRGVRFYPFDPRPGEVLLEDVARGLAFQCRFNGHVSEFYSVAQHAVLVSAVVPPELALWGLLHDAAEAYVGDLVRPVKLGLPAFRAVEDRIQAAVVERFDLSPAKEPAEVKAADRRALATERRDLIPARLPWSSAAEPLPDRIVPLGPRAAERAFLTRYASLDAVRRRRVDGS